MRNRYTIHRNNQSKMMNSFIHISCNHLHKFYIFYVLLNKGIRNRFLTMVFSSSLYFGDGNM